MLSDPPPMLQARVHYEGEDGLVPDFYRTMPLKDTEPVGDQLREDLPFWTPPNPVLLDLPPGTGKTSFVYNTLIPEALSRGKNLLLVSNRVALSSQQKRAVMEQLQSPFLKTLTDEGVRQTEDFGPVRVITYHRLPALLKDQNSAAWRASLAFVVFDECHFFAADSLFNAGAEYYLRLASERFCHAVRIYMTGTSWDILEPLAEAETTAYYHRHTLYLQWTPPRVCFRYTIPADYSRFRLRWFSELKDLKNPIREQPEERWLIFVARKKQGQTFARDLGSCAAYLDADCKGSDLWNRIVREERFSQQVLVTTPVLDAGINIVDSSLRNVAVITDNRTALLQMAGRKRMRGDRHFNLWVCNPSLATLAHRYRQYSQWLEWFDRLDKCRSPEQHQALMEQLWREDDPGLRNLFRLSRGKIFPNTLARHVLRRRCFLFECVLRGETTFKREVELWLGMDPDATGAAAALHNFYMEHGEEPLEETLQNTLRQLINTCYAEAGYKDPQPTRSDRLQARALTNRLQDVRLPYTICAEEGTWILQKRA